MRRRCGYASLLYVEGNRTRCRVRNNNTYDYDTYVWREKETVREKNKSYNSFVAAALHAIMLSGHHGRFDEYGAEPTLKRPSATATGLGGLGCASPQIDGIQIRLIKRKW